MKMIMKMIIWLLMLLAITSSPTADPMTRITLDDFINDEGEYVFRDTRWGMTKGEVEEALGITLGEGRTVPNGVLLFEENNNFDIFGKQAERGSRTIQFNDEALAAVIYDFGGEYEDIRQFYDETIGKITERLGEPQETLNLASSDVDMGETRLTIPSREENRWTHPYGDGEYFISLSFIYRDDGTASIMLGAGMVTAAQIAFREGAGIK